MVCLILVSSGESTNISERDGERPPRRDHICSDSHHCCLFLRVALAAGLSYGVLNWAFHSISGGHMNPAVTMAVMLNGRITFTRAICYWGAQIVGGMVGALIAKGMR